MQCRDGGGLRQRGSNFSSAHCLFWPALVAQDTMHIQFDEAGQPRPHAAHPSVAAGFQCVSSVRVDFQSDATYVFELAHNGQGLVAAALSNTRIKLFNFR